jgi:hypothetical protein
MQSVVTEGGGGGCKPSKLTKHCYSDNISLMSLPPHYHHLFFVIKDVEPKYRRQCTFVRYGWKS